MFKRLAAITASTGILALLVAPPATAGGPQGFSSYGAGSSATALVLTLLGEELAVSSTAAAVGSAPEAAADGAALLLAGTPVPGAAPSSTPGGLPSNEACPLQADLDEITMDALSALELEVACVRTQTSITDGAPAAESLTDETTILVTGLGGAVLEPILTPLFENVDTVSQQLIDALDPIFAVVEDTTQVQLNTILEDILADLDETEVVLAEIVVGATASRDRANDVEGVVAEAASNAVTINLFPGLASQLVEIAGLEINAAADPLLSVVIGQAKASVVRNAATGAAEADASAAQLASITAADELGIIQEITGQLTGAIDGLAVDQLSCDGGALADIVCIDLGAVRELTAEEITARFPDLGAGAVGREASAASVAVLPILSEALGIAGPGVLGLSLATADAAAFAVPAGGPLPFVPTPSAPAPAPLPRTGADVPIPLALALFAAAGVGLAVVRRTRSI